MQLNIDNLSVFFDSANAKFNQQLTSAPSHYKKLCMDVTSTGADEIYGWASDMPEMREWVGDRVVHEFTSYGYVVRNKTFEQTISIPRDHFEDDNLGVYPSRFAMMGRSVGTFPDELAFGMLGGGTTRLCYDGQPFFSTGHAYGPPIARTTYSNLQGPAGTDVAGPAWYLLDATQPLKPLVWQERRPFVLTPRNSPTDPQVFDRNRFVYGVDGRCNVGYGLWQLATRSMAPLTAAYYSQVRAAMMAQRSDSGRVLGVMPNLLLCGPELEAQARALLLGEIANSTSNPWKGTADLVVTQFLSSGEVAAEVAEFAS